jgi:central glycolytic genes regulator
MKDLIQLQKVIYPDLLDIMQQRYRILYTIYLFQPIGRRGIIEQTNLPERLIRNETLLLQNQGLMEVSTKGMVITEDGEHIIESLSSFIRELTGLTTTEKELQMKTGISKVILVAGDSDTNSWIKQELGRATVGFLKDTIDRDVTIAVTGGTTMAAVAEAMQPIHGIECTFVPARGGVGEKVENQANTIVAQMAKAEKGAYHLLHVPDPLSEELYLTMLEEPSVKETLPIIKNADIVLHGIGEAFVMANRRKTTTRIIEKLKHEKAVSEAFGYYCNQAGKVVHKVRTLGIHLDDLENTNVITVAGGKSKAKAIASFMKQGKTDVLITDEAAAKEMLNNKLI